MRARGSDAGKWFAGAVRVLQERVKLLAEQLSKCAAVSRVNRHQTQDQVLEGTPHETCPFNVQGGETGVAISLSPVLFVTCVMVEAHIHRWVSVESPLCAGRLPVFCGTLS